MRNQGEQEFYEKYGGKTIILLVLVAIILISVLPMVVEFVRARRKRVVPEAVAVDVA